MMSKNSAYALVIRVILMAICLGWLWMILSLLNSYQITPTVYTPAIHLVSFTQWIGIILGGFVLFTALWRIRSEKLMRLHPDSCDWRAIRAAIYCPLIPLGLTSLLTSNAVKLFEDNNDLVPTFFVSVLVIVLLLWMFWLFHRSLSAFFTETRAGWLKLADVIGMNVVVLLIVGETLLFITNKIHPSVMLHSRSSDVVTRINALRWKPNSLRFNFFTNSKGYNDEEFFIATPSDCVIGVLADSFGFGIVPHEFNFTTVAERELQRQFSRSFDRIAVNNYGIPGTAMEEYAYILETEVLSTKPSIVVICLFVGNDVIESRNFRRSTNSRYNFQNWFLWLLPTRTMMLIKENHCRAEKVADHKDSRLVREQGKIPDYIFDSSKESPEMSDEKFTIVETYRIDVCNPQNKMAHRGFDGIGDGLKLFKSHMDSNLLVMLIPDEFQVNDALYERLLAHNPSRAIYQQDYPQTIIRSICHDLDIRCIDMLPALREGQKIRRTYHLNDTHLNAHGNKIVGDLLGQELTRMIIGVDERKIANSD